MSRERPEGTPGRRPRSVAAVAAAARGPSTRQLSRLGRERRQQRLLLMTGGAIALVALTIIGFGTYREVYGFPNEAVARVGGEAVTLRTYTDALTVEMRNLQSQVAGAQNDPNRASNSVQNLISAQETLPEQVLERQIENTIIRNEAKRRGLTIPPTDVDTEINRNLSIQRDFLNQPTFTPTSTATPRPTATETPEGFEPSPTSTPTATRDPEAPSPTPTLSPTLDPLTPTATRTPFPTRPSLTPIVTATNPPALLPDEFDRAYRDLLPLLRSESDYRAGVELQLQRDRLRLAIGSGLPTSGERARVHRIVTSTRDEARVALIQVEQQFPLEEIAGQANERPAEGFISGDLGWVARGAETRELDEIAFSSQTALNQWTEPYAAGNHWESILVVERGTGAYDAKNQERMRERAFREWLDEAKQSPDILRELSAQERQWAVDRASKGIFETTTDRRRR